MGLMWIQWPESSYRLVMALVGETIGDEMEGRGIGGGGGVRKRLISVWLYVVKDLQ